MSKLSLLIFMGLLVIGPFSKGYAEISESEEKSQIEEVHDTKNLNKLLIDYNKDQEKVLSDSQKIIHNDDSSEISDKDLEITPANKTEPVLKKAVLNLFDAEKKAKKIDPKVAQKMKYSEALSVALGPLQKMSEMELVKLLRENTKGSSVESYIEDYPKLAVFTVRLIKDKEALPGLAKILDDQDRLIHFISVMLISILFAFFLKKFMKREGRSVPKAVAFWFFRFVLISSLRMGIVIYFYGTELNPTFQIISKTFF